MSDRDWEDCVACEGHPVMADGSVCLYCDGACGYWVEPEKGPDPKITKLLDDAEGWLKEAKTKRPRQSERLPRS